MNQNKIKYWEKNQELDKFNYQINIDSIKNTTFFLGSFFLPLMVAGILLIANQNYAYGFTISFSSIMFFIILNSIMTNKNGVWRDNAKRDFAIRDVMLRIWYKDDNKEKNGKVNTDLLDLQFEEIKKRYQVSLSKKDLEDIAECIINKKTNPKIS
ncbi:MAG: hypothetical protein COV33_02555 [Candidatus Zambryskibacteria bacterium CG10_big_fil_rev_8_21_14_0_10_34_34]|uniref:Uncharacterized protein n=1 Tax=Candidatus Zambryskibacteria bacterium CG10_big_fil_rev_8_21_14_0_10_34_34 TaxID=1975114 RepID=A0A2H0R082_9BACT|nr:MAG: hypothetical protein COV33_02555 [Candidatus Zambryskibacteria bacterium CG10_big_fil_rev_8_21_14_0_10_34_34]